MSGRSTTPLVLVATLFDFFRKNQVVTTTSLNRDGAADLCFVRGPKASAHDLVLVNAKNPKTLDLAFPNYFFLDERFLGAPRNQFAHGASLREIS